MSDDQMPVDVNQLQNALKNAIVKLMAQSQTIQQLMTANVDLRAALHLLQIDKDELEKQVSIMVNQTQVSLKQEDAETSTDTTESLESTDTTENTEVAPTVDDSVNADPVSA